MYARWLHRLHCRHGLRWQASASYQWAGQARYAAGAQEPLRRAAADTRSW